ncbi:MAG: hypothetical protein JWP87_1343 [Labilithrix sp.]|nr:hypothetical protein [Labilithrix sp.]
MRGPWRLFQIVPIVLASACATLEERPRTEDDARQLAPLPACLVQLRSGKPAGGGEHAARSLREEQIWPLVYPSFDPKRGTVGEEARTCTGRAPMREKGLTGGTPAKIEEGAIALSGGSDRLKVAWLRSETYPDGTTGGALALLRTVDGTAEVYAVGGYRGRAKTSFTTERIGPEVVVVAQDDGCAARKPKEGCEAVTSVFRPRFGVLERAAAIAQERVSYASDSEPGVRGRVEYRLSSSIQYVDGGIRVLEQVTVRDDLAREVRKAELERLYTFAPDGSMVVDEDSLWSRVVVAASAKPSGPKVD